jgi:hypothetical protein
VHEEAASDRASAGVGRRVSTLWVILVAVIGLAAVAHNATQFWDEWRGRRVPDVGFAVDAIVADHYVRVSAVTPGGLMARAGVRIGDLWRPDDLGFMGYAPVGAPFGFTLRHGATLSHHVVIPGLAPPRPDQQARSLAMLFVDLSWTSSVLIGLFVAIRSRGRASTILLGAALICTTMGGNRLYLYELDSVLKPTFYIAFSAMFFAGPPLMLIFSLRVVEEALGRVSRFIWNGTLLYGAATSLFSTMITYEGMTLSNILPINFFDTNFYIPPLQAIGYISALGILCWGWAKTGGQNRTRLGFMVVAIGLVTICIRVASVLVVATGDAWTLSNPLVLVNVVGGLLGAGVFAYAVLRHRVLDLGFAVNRTLVYAAVSAILLSAFGLTEWAVDHLVPVAGREKNGLLDAAIAVGVFLTFHRVRDAVEHGVERLFFRRWQMAEKRLRLFVHEAAFVTRSDTLTGRFGEALGHFSDGAEAAVYLVDEGGVVRRADGSASGVGETIDLDDPALVSIRAEPKAMRLEDTGTSLPFRLIAPMVNRNQVIGVALLGAKPDDTDYRPDEIELIEWATRQVGLDLHALKVEQLELTATHQRDEISTLRSLIPKPA